MKDSKAVSKMIKSIIAGVLVSIGLMLLLCLLGGFLIAKEWIPEEAGSIVSWTICAAASFLGCWVTQKKMGSARLLVCLISGGVLLLLLVLFSINLPEGMERSWYSVGLVALGAVGAALLGAGKSGRHC